MEAWEAQCSCNRALSGSRSYEIPNSIAADASRCSSFEIDASDIV